MAILERKSRHFPQSYPGALITGAADTGGVPPGPRAQQCDRCTVSSSDVTSVLSDVTLPHDNTSQPNITINQPTSQLKRDTMTVTLPANSVPKQVMSSDVEKVVKEGSVSSSADTLLANVGTSEDDEVVCSSDDDNTDHTDQDQGSQSQSGRQVSVEGNSKVCSVSSKLEPPPTSTPQPNYQVSVDLSTVDTV